MMYVIEQSYDFVPVSIKMNVLLDVEQMHDALYRYAIASKYGELNGVAKELEKIINRSGGRLHLI